MMTENYNNENTNRAWNSLYSRLQQDGLVTDANTKSKENMFLHPTRLRWAATIIIICISSTLIWVLNQNGKRHELLSLYNSENSTTLVTTLEDGSIVYLGEQATLHFPKHFKENKREVFLQGNALFDVSGNKERPFIIETSQVKIEVLGTAFNVRSSHSFSLSVERGEVRVTSKNSGQSVLTKSGETVSLNGSQLQKTLTENADQFSSYFKQIQFKDERLADIIQVINRNYPDAQLEITPKLENRKLTVTFSNDSPLSMAQLISVALDLKYTQKEKTIYISELNN